MKFLLILVLHLLLVIPDGAAQDPVKVALPEGKAFWDELENIRDPFESPIKKPKIEQAIKPIPVFVKPVEPVRPSPPPQPKPSPTPIQPQLPKPVIPQVVDQKAAGVLLLSGVKINGIIWNTDMPQAIVNDRVVRVGDDLQGAKILSIKKEGVEVIHNGIKHILTISVDKQ